MGVLIAKPPIAGTFQHSRHLPAIPEHWNMTKTSQRKREDLRNDKSH